MGETDDLIQKATDAKNRIDKSDCKSSGAVKEVSKQYLDRLITELNQINSGQAYGEDEGADKKRRQKAIEREIELVVQANTGIKTSKGFDSWWQAAKHYGGNAALLGVAVAVGMAVALCNPVGLAFVGAVVLGAVAAVAAFALYKGLSCVWDWVRGNNSQAKVRSAAQLELGLDKAKEIELSTVTGTGVPLRPATATKSTAVPNPLGSQQSTQLPPGAQAAQNRRFPRT